MSKIRLGVLGGGGDSLIGVLHRVASNMYDRYEFDRYEKIEFDLNNIDEKLMDQKIFDGMEMVFDQIDTSKITGKVFLPIFIN